MPLPGSDFSAGMWNEAEARMRIRDHFRCRGIFYKAEVDAEIINSRPWPD